MTSTEERKCLRLMSWCMAVTATAGKVRAPVFMQPPESYVAPAVIGLLYGMLCPRFGIRFGPCCSERPQHLLADMFVALWATI